MQITRYKEVVSTNAKIKELIAKEGLQTNTAIMADFQTGGRGQGQKHWHSRASENLLVSFGLNLNLPALKHFRIIMSISYLMKIFLAKYNIYVQIKWPNDIYADGKKIAGILIENSLKGSTIHNSIIGLGLNVNQETFPEELPNPVSMTQLTGTKYQRDELLQELIRFIESDFDFLLYNDLALNDVYTKTLFQLNELRSYRTVNGNLKGMILGIKESGELIIKDENGREHTFIHGEVEYVLRDDE